MKVIVGIGNPGKKYADTRHNVGFMVIDALAGAKGITVKDKKYRSLLGTYRDDDTDVWLVKPQTYVNRTGLAVADIVEEKQLPLTDLLIVVDDFALPLGVLRFRRRGSSGSHNGLESVINNLQTDEFARLRLGIGSADRSDAVDFVLSRFKRSQEKTLAEMIELGCIAIQQWISLGIDECMNRFN